MPEPSLGVLQSVLECIGRAGLGDVSWREALLAIRDLTGAEVALLMRPHDPVPIVTAGDPGSRASSSAEWLCPDSTLVRLWLRGLPGDRSSEPTFTLLARQCALSWAVQERLAGFDLQVRWSQFALDRLAFGVLLLDGSARVHFANRSAAQLLAEPGELALVNDHLVAASPLYSKRLSALLVRVVRGHSQGEGNLAALLRVPYREQDEVLELLVAAIAPARALTSEIAVGLLYAPKSGASTPIQVLRSLYGLTDAESRVVHRLLRGRTVEQAAGDLGVAQDTIRQHLKSIFLKVGTTRQSDLIAALLTGPGELRWD